MIGRRITHYRIQERLGAGGMGEVFLAEDLALGRPTALKLLPPSVTEILRSRLRREAEFIARLQHPAISTFYEAGEEDGIFFLAMEFVRGETLRAALRRGPLPVDRALGLARDLLEALAHAHAVGILHRDIKPENVMLTEEGGVKLLDFGVAKAMAPVSPDAVTREGQDLTQAGAIVGTPGYLAPEQLAGGVLDAGVDLFALGVVLYEALHARPVYPGRDAWDRMQGMLSGRGPVPPDSGLPEGLRRLLLRAVSPDAKIRFRQASAFLAALQEIEETPTASTLPRSVAVLPLAQQGGEAADAWIGTAIADTLVADLGRVRGLQVIGPERARRVRRVASEESGDSLEIGRRLGCRWILSGGFQSMGDRVRISPILTEVGTGQVAWGQKLDGLRSDLFELQDRLSDGVALALSVELDSAKKAERPRFDAYELCARGKELFLKLEKGSFERAHELMERAMEADPEFADPYERLCAIHAMRFTFQTDPQELETCQAYARRAVALDPTLAEPHVYLCYALWRLGRPEEALREAEEASRLDPQEARAPYFAGCIKWSLYRREEAKRDLQTSLQLGPDHGFGWMILGSLCGELGEFEEARWCLQQALALEGRAGLGPTAGAAAFLAEIVRRQGKNVEALGICQEALSTIERSDHMYRDSFRGVALATRGRIGLDAGDREAAAAAFQQAIAHVEGRRRTLGGGHLLAQAWAGLAEATGTAEFLETAESVFRETANYDHSWLWLTTREFALWTLGRAAHSLGQEERGEGFWQEARATGFSAAGLEGVS